MFGTVRVALVSSVVQGALRLVARGRPDSSGARDIGDSTCVGPVNCCANGDRGTAAVGTGSPLILVGSMLRARSRRSCWRCLGTEANRSDVNLKNARATHRLRRQRR